MVTSPERSNVRSTIKSQIFRLCLAIKCATYTVEGPFGGFQGQGIHWLSFRSDPMHVVPHKREFSVIFRYFTLFYLFYPLPRAPIPHQMVRFYAIYVYAYTSTIP